MNKKMKVVLISTVALYAVVGLVFILIFLNKNKNTDTAKSLSTPLVVSESVTSSEEKELSEPVSTETVTLIDTDTTDDVQSEVSSSDTSESLNQGSDDVANTDDANDADDNANAEGDAENVATDAEKEEVKERTYDPNDKYWDKQYAFITVFSEEIEGTVKIRSEADATSKGLASLYPGAVGLVLEKGDEWCKVQYKEITGYLPTDHLDFFER